LDESQSTNNLIPKGHFVDIHRAIVDLRAHLELIDHAIVTFERLSSENDGKREKPRRRRRQSGPKKEE
jgi:hypothetical protein